MVDRLQQNLGKYPFVTLADVKDYLSISSTTQDSRIENAIKYATGMVEHYIGQEILANDYVEIFDGGKTSVMTSRLPLSNVYLVSEYDGSNDVILNDPSSIGRPITTDGDTLTVSTVNGVAGNVTTDTGTPVAVDGDNGGTFTVEPDGTWTFDPGTDFDDMQDGDTKTTKVTGKFFNH